MTKVIILGNDVDKTKSKKINLVKLLDSTIDTTCIKRASCKTADWKIIELVKRGPAGHYDLMFAYDENRSKGTLYLGHFNDGVV